MPIRIPADWEEHKCCWMAWAVHPEWREWNDAIKHELSAVIHTIALYEPVYLLAPHYELPEARVRFSGGNIEIIEAPVDDIWMRDIAPTFALYNNEVVAIDWNFNGWGGTPDRPTRAGDQLARTAESIFGVPRISVPFVAEGGAFITDGQGTLVTTRSCLLNQNRNPKKLAERRAPLIESELAKFGIDRVIWLEGDASEPITSGHVDGYVMFKGVGKVLFEMSESETDELSSRSRDFAILKKTRNTHDNSISVEVVRAPRDCHVELSGPYSAPCYLNTYIANGAVIIAAFGDGERDEAARDAFACAFPERKIEQLRIAHIAAGGGGIRCLTQPMAVVNCIRFP